MKTVFLPTDFSEASKQGIHYGLKMGKALFPEGVRFVLLHVYHLSMPSGEFEQMYAADDLQKKESEARMLELIEELKALYPDTALDSKVTYGYPSNAIVDESDKDEADLLIIVGKQRSLFDRIMQGSNARRIAYQSSCPVLVVPEDCAYKKMEKMLFATDFEAKDLNEQVTFLKQFVEAFDPEIKTLHLYTKDESELSTKAEKSEALFDLLGSDKYSHFFLEHEAPAKGITDFTKGYQADVLVLTHHDRTVLENVFHRSMTKEFIDTLDVPVLILHSKQMQVEGIPFNKKVNIQLEKWRGELDEMQVQFHLGQKAAGEKWDEKKEVALRQLEGLKERLQGTSEVAEDKWDHFKSEIGEAFHHVKKAFIGQKK